MRLSHLVLLSAALLATGCTGTLAESFAGETFAPTSAALRDRKVDVRASEVIWEVPSLSEPVAAHMPSVEQQAALAREQIAAGLQAKLGAGDGKPVRYRVRVLETDRSRLMVLAPCLLVLSYFGCPVGSDSATVEVELDVDGVIYKGRGEYSQISTLYEPEVVEPAAGTAVAPAIVVALADIDRQLAQRPAAASTTAAGPTTVAATTGGGR